MITSDYPSALPQISSLQLVSDSNSALTLNCTSTGSPAITVVWRKDGHFLTNFSTYATSQIMRDGLSSTYDNLLDIKAEPSELAGTYSCIIHDSLGHNSELATIQVKGIIISKLKIAQIKKDSETIIGLQLYGYDGHFTVGQSASVTCSYDLAFTSIEWLYNNETIVSSATSQLDLSFNPVNDSIHGKQYTCRASTPYGIQEERLTIQIKGRE